MKLQIKNEYQVLKDRVFTGEVELNIEGYIKSNGIEIISKETLSDILYYYLNYECDEVTTIDNEIAYGGCEFEILNIDKILEEYSYLIVPEKELTCCERAAKNSYRYCPVCGTKIIY